MARETLHLNKAVEAQQTPILRADTLLHLFLLPQEVFVDIQRLGSLLQWLVDVSFADTLCLTGTALTILRAIRFSNRLYLCLASSLIANATGD